jgi:hypothetical protein
MGENKHYTSILYFPGMTFEKRNSLLLSVKVTVFLPSLRLPANLTRVTETDGSHFSLQATVPSTLTSALIKDQRDKCYNLTTNQLYGKYKEAKEP